jgi:hypothetical protein
MKTLYARIGAALVALVATTGIAVTACSQGSEGDRCNPDLAAGESECGGGLTCLQPALCPEAYCCPTTADGGAASSSNPNCQTGCNGGAASICNSGQDDGGACAFACSNDPADLTSTSVCTAAAPDGGTGGDAAPGEASSPATDAASEAAKEASASDGGPG